ncbi:MAG: hypothetical protein ACXAC7_00500, partial [Candidatus Hodarchaeales archaeon]
MSSMKLRKSIFGLLIMFSMVMPIIAIPIQVSAIDSSFEQISNTLSTSIDESISEQLTNLLRDSQEENNVLSDQFDGVDRMAAIEEAVKSYTAQPDSLGSVEGTPALNDDLDLGNLLTDTSSEYRKVWEPWQTKAAIRTLITSPDKEFLLAGGGYLYDNEIKVYRYNHQSNQYDHVWDSGDSIIGSDVVSLGWGDTDNNKFPEVVAGSADGHIYVFEQVHIYDPKTNTENRFDLVWKSPVIQQVWGITVADVDKDYLPDIVAGSWDGSIHVYEYTEHSGYPFTQDHWIDYEEKYTAKLPGDERITSLTTADTNFNGLPEIIVGTWSGNVYIYENNGTVLWKEDLPFPLTQDNSYKLIYQNQLQFWNPITKIAVGNLDGDVQKELSFLVPGQGVFSFDYDLDTEDYYFNKVTKPVATWELDTGKFLNDDYAAYAVNSYVDWFVNGSDVYALWNNTNTWELRAESFLEWWTPSHTKYNTSMAFRPDDDYSYFFMNASAPIGSNASAIVDFGFAQEASGDGRFADGQSYKGYDMQITMASSSPPLPNQWLIELSPDMEDWTTVNLTEMTVAPCTTKCVLYIDTDPALNRARFLHYRYIRMTFFAPGQQLVDAIYTSTLARALTEATSLTIGSVDVDYETSISGGEETDKLVVGTSDGKIYVYEYDPSKGEVDIVWESYTWDWFNVGTNIWDIVQVQNEGTFPTWLGRNGVNKTLDINQERTAGNIAGNYVSHTHAHVLAFEMLDPFFAEQPDDLIVTDDTGYTYLYPGSSNVFTELYGQLFFLLMNNYYGGTGLQLSHSFNDVNDDGFPETLLTGWWNNVPANPTKDTTTQAGLDVWLSGGLTALPLYIGPIPLATLDITGMLARALEDSQAQPSAVMTDLDKDGDQDVVFTNGRVYVLWNLMAGALWQFDATYFEGINDNLAGRLYTNPEVVDFDKDGDDDLIFTYSLTGSKPRHGATYWQNEGTPTEPKWIMKKWFFINPIPNSNLAFNNHTNIEFLKNRDTGRIINMTAYSDKLDAIIGFEADYTNHDHFMIATYPLLRRLEVNLRDSENVKNFGYRIFETWNTQPELKEWSQTIRFDDVDQDGRNEVVVGDYDNNLYIFEYLTSGLNGSVNTFKRAFRSFDLNQTEQLDESPYAADDLAGLSGIFNRTLWDHANNLLTGTDLDKDGYQEVVVTAGLSVFIFEATKRDDTYELMWQTDLRFSKFTPLFDSASEITALSGGMDMDYNQRGELILAAGPILMIYEYAGNNNFVELYAGRPDGNGRYAAIGNVAYGEYAENYIFQNLKITSIEVTDIDNNNYQDIVIGGGFVQPYGREDGYFTILEHRLGTIVPTVEAPLKIFRELPIADIEIADQDYDGRKEIIIGHPKGVDIYEYDQELSDEEGRISFNKLTHITSSMNHPIIPVKPILLLPQGYTDKISWEARDHDLLMVRYTVDNPTFRAVTGTALEPGDLVEVVGVELLYGDFAFSKLFIIYSKDEGDSWKPFPGFIVADNAVFGNYYSFSIYKEKQPTIIQLDDGTIIIGYVGQTVLNDINYIFTVEFSNSGLTDPYAVRIIDTLIGEFSSPSVFVNPTRSGKASVSYIRTNYTGNDVDDVKIEFNHRITTTYWGDPLAPDGNVSKIGGAGLDYNGTYFASAQDVIYHRPTNGFVLAFSGMYYRELKPDQDIFIFYLTNDSFVANLTSRVSRVSTDDLYPSISTLYDENDFSIILAYEEQGISPGGRVMVSHSEDLGLSWNPPEPLPTQLDFMVNYCLEGFGCFLMLANPKDESIKNEVQDDMGETYYAPTTKKKLEVTKSIDESYSRIGNFKIAQDQRVGSGTFKNDEPEKQASLRTSSFNFYWIASIEAFSPAIVGRVDGGFAFTYASRILYGDLSTFLQNIKSTIQTSVSQGLGMQTLTLQPGKTTQSMMLAANVGSNAQETTTSVQADHVITATTALGVITSLVSGVNPSSLFALFDTGETVALATGDSDGDARQEIGIASDRGAFLNEIASTKRVADDGYTRLYQETWTKTDYEHKLHDIAIGDANKNGFAEILIAGEEGNVYSYEIVDIDQDTTNLEFLTYLWENIQPSGSVGNPNAPDEKLAQVADFNGDEQLDVAYATFSPPPWEPYQYVAVVDGTDGINIWAVNLADVSSGYPGIVTTLEIADINSDNISDVIIGLDSGAYIIFDGFNGNILDSGQPYDKPVVKTISANFVEPDKISTVIAYPDKVIIVQEGIIEFNLNVLYSVRNITDIIAVNSDVN